MSLNRQPIFESQLQLSKYLNERSLHIHLIRFETFKWKKQVWKIKRQKTRDEFSFANNTRNLNSMESGFF